MSDHFPVHNPRPWGVSLTISSIIIVAYVTLSLFIG